MLLYISLSIIFISILFLIYSFEKNKLSLLLSAYFIILAVYGLTHYFTTYDSSDFWMAIFFNHFNPIWVLAGPCLYLYVKSTLLDAEQLPKHSWIHFLPSIIYVVAVGPYYLKPFSEKLELAHAIHNNLEYLKQIDVNLILTTEINFIVRPTLLLCYALASLFILIKIYKKEKTSVEIPNTQKKISFPWLFTLVSVSITMAISFLIVTLLFIITPFSGPQLMSHPLHTITGMAFLIMTVSLFFFPQILYGLPHYNKKDYPHKISQQILPNIEKTMPETRMIDENDPFVQLSIQIQEYLANEKPYLCKDFSMHDIAVAMNVPNHHISYCLNQIMQTNFANLKNKLRVEYSISLLEQNKTSTLSIEGIAQNSGFATRSTFYSAFKKITGTTPTEYILNMK